MLEIVVQRDEVGFLQRMRWQATASAWANEVGPMMVASLRERAPVGKGPNSGELRDSIKYRSSVSRTDASLQFFADVPYTKYVLEGTDPHEIRPRRARALHWNDGGDRFAQLVHHPGTLPNPFPRRALVPVLPLAQRGFKEAFQRALEGR